MSALRQDFMINSKDGLSIKELNLEQHEIVLFCVTVSDVKCNIRVK